MAEKEPLIVFGVQRGRAKGGLGDTGKYVEGARSR